MSQKNKTQPHNMTVSAYLKTLEVDDKKQAKELIAIFTDATKTTPVIWGNIVGFGAYHYKYDSGREGDFLATGFAMRKSGPTIYIMPGYEDYADILEKIGPHKIGKSCIYFKNVEQIHTPTFKKLIKQGLKDLKQYYPVKL